MLYEVITGMDAHNIPQGNGKKSVGVVGGQVGSVHEGELFNVCKCGNVCKTCFLDAITVKGYIFACPVQCGLQPLKLTLGLVVVIHICRYIHLFGHY